MDTTLHALLEECTQGSDQERLSFPQVLGKLGAAGVERYHADLLRGDKIYYLPDGASHVVPSSPVEAAPPIIFASEEVEAAVRAIQAGAIGYRAFCRRIADAGCVGYHVTLAGRRAIYYGRTGDQHVEHFPAASEVVSPAAAAPPRS